MDFLQTCLQLHVASDEAAVFNTPHITSTLTAQHFESSHVSKWTNRINALLRAKDPGARWAGLVLALKSSRLSRNLLTGSAQNWVALVLPMLSRNEVIPVWKAAIRLVAFMSLSTTTLPDFQRTVIHPNAPKFSSALLSLAEKQVEQGLTLLCLDTLTAVVRTFPSSHRSMTDSLSSLCLRRLDGSSIQTPDPIALSISNLYSTLHVTGGKVGGSALWRKGVDETIVFVRKALEGLRTSYIKDGFVPVNNEPITHKIDRLHCGIELLCCFMRSEVSRPVIVPVNALLEICVSLLSVEESAELRSDIDPALRSAEAAVVLNIHKEGCKLTTSVSGCLRAKLSPYFNQILLVVTHHFEQQISISQRLAFVSMLATLFEVCLPPSNPLFVGRLVKTLLPSLTFLLSSEIVKSAPNTSEGSGRKTGKQKRNGFDEDEVFKVSRDKLCESEDDGELVLAVLKFLPVLMKRTPTLPSYLQSLTSRVYLSLLTLLPAMSAATVSSDPTLKENILACVRDACVDFASGSSAVLSKSLPLVIDAVCKLDSTNHNELLRRNVHNVDLMIHPRLPPLVRALPSYGSLTLVYNEEGQDERTTRESLALRSLEEDGTHAGMDIDISQPQQSTVEASAATVDAQFNVLTGRPTEAVQLVNRSAFIAQSSTQAIAAGAEMTAAPIQSFTNPFASSITTTQVTEQVRERDSTLEDTVGVVSQTSPEDLPPTSTSSEVKSKSQTSEAAQQPTIPHDPMSMAVDSDDDDIEYPTLNLESDTDSGEE